MHSGGGESALSEHCWWNRSEVVKPENWGWMLMYISRWKIGNLVVKRQYRYDHLRRKRISRRFELDNLINSLIS
jgi:hypothetical protein